MLVGLTPFIGDRKAEEGQSHSPLGPRHPSSALRLGDIGAPSPWAFELRQRLLPLAPWFSASGFGWELYHQLLWASSLQRADHGTSQPPESPKPMLHSIIIYFCLSVHPSIYLSGLLLVLLL